MIITEFEKINAITLVSLFVIGLLLGLLSAFVFISMPLTNIYLTKYNELTKNDTLKCFDSTNMSYPIMVDRMQMREFCDANYCNPIVGHMPEVIG